MSTDPAEAMFDEVFGEVMDAGTDTTEPATQEAAPVDGAATVQPAEQPVGEDGGNVAPTVPQEPAPNAGAPAAPGTPALTEQTSQVILQPHPATINAPADQRLYSDPKGNIVDAKGTTIYSAGKERRMFETNTNARAHIDTLNTTIGRLTQENQALQNGGALEGFAQQHGLDNEGLATAAQFMSRYNRDPIGTMREMIALTTQQGYTIDQLVGGENGQQNPQTLIAAAVRQELQNAGIAQNNAAPATAPDQVSADYVQFQQSFPLEAQVHDEIITKMFPKMPGDTPFEKASNAVFQLRAYATQHGLDMNTDLRPQLQALAARTAQPTPAPVNAPAIPNGGSVMPGAVAANEASPMAAVEESYEDIVRASMRASGAIQ